MPTGFTWVLPRQLAGAGRPGLLRPVADDLAFLRDAGIRVLVNLTEEPLGEPLTAFGLRGLHFPLPECELPTPGEVDVACARICDELRRGEPVLVHCHAGLGRTGLVLACCLVTLGAPSDRAIRELRTRRPLYVHSLAHQEFVAEFANAAAQRP